jgi:hypothetical protein
MPALTLFYTGMDMVVAYEANGRAPTTRRDVFIAWAQRYLSPCLPAGVSAADLWDGRRQVFCTRRTFGEASAGDALGRRDPIAFCGRNTEARSLQAALRQAGIPVERVVAVDTILDAFESGITRYIDDLETHPDRMGECVEKAEDLLSAVNFWRPRTEREAAVQATRVRFVNLLGESVEHLQSFDNAGARQATERVRYA